MKRLLSAFRRKLSTSPSKGSKADWSIVGESGRTYDIIALAEKNEGPFSCVLFKTEHDGKTYWAEGVRPPVYKEWQTFAAEVQDVPGLHLPMDVSKEMSCVIRQPHRGTVRDLLDKHVNLPDAPRLNIMRTVAEALQGLHSRGWTHNNINPAEITVDWSDDDTANCIVTNPLLSGLHHIHRTKPGEFFTTELELGDNIWQAPEGRRLHYSRAHDIYALGLTYLYMVGMIHLVTPIGPSLHKALQKSAGTTTSDEQSLETDIEMLLRHFAAFGPVPDTLYKYIKDASFQQWFRIWSEAAEILVNTTPELRARNLLPTILQPHTVDLFLKMTNLDPMARPTIDQVLAHPFWETAPRTGILL